MARGCGSGFRREREALRLWSAEQTKIENGTWHEQRAEDRHVRDRAEAVPRILDRPEPLTSTRTLNPRFRMWEAHLEHEHAAGENHARA